MVQLYLSYRTDSLIDSINLMDLNKYFVQAHSLKLGQNAGELTLEWILCVRGEDSGELAFRIQHINAILESALLANPPYNLGQPLLLWMKLGDEQTWSIFTVKSAIAAPMDLGIADGHTYGLHVRLSLWKHSLADSFVVVNEVSPDASIFVAQVPGDRDAAGTLDLGMLPQVAKLYVGIRGHKYLNKADFQPHFPVTSDFPLTASWQTQDTLLSPSGPFNRGLFSVFLHVVDSTPFFPIVSDLSAELGTGNLDAGFYEYMQQGTDYLGNVGRGSNVTALTIDGPPLIFSSPLSTELGVVDAIGGLCPNPFNFSVDAPSYPTVGPGGYNFSVASDGWVLSSNITQPLLVPDNPLYPHVAATNKMPPTNKDVGYAQSLVRIPTPQSLAKRRSVQLGIDFRSMALGNLQSPIFYPILGSSGVMFDGMGWKLYMSTEGDVVKDWQKGKLAFSPLNAAPPVGSNTYLMTLDWSLGFTAISLKVNGELAGVLAVDKTPQDTDPLFGAIVTNQLPDYVNFRVEDLNAENWQFTKVEVETIDSGSGGGSNTSSSSSSSISHSDSHTDSTDISGTRGGSSDGVNSNSFASDSGNSSVLSSAAGFGSNQANTDGESTNTAWLTYKNIPVTFHPAQGIEVVHEFSGEVDNHSVDRNGNDVKEVGPQTQIPDLSSSTVSPVGFQNSSYFPVLGKPQYGLLFDEYNYFVVNSPDEAPTLKDYVAPPITTSLSDSIGSPGGSSNDNSDSSSVGTNSSGSSSASGSVSGSLDSSDSTSTSTSDSMSDSTSTSSGGSSSSTSKTSSGHRYKSTLQFEIPLPSYTRLVIYIGRVVSETTTKNSSSNSSQDSSVDSSTSSTVGSDTGKGLTKTISSTMSNSGSTNNSASTSITSSNNSSSNSSTTTSKDSTHGVMHNSDGAFNSILQTTNEVGGKSTSKEIPYDGFISTDFGSVLGIPSEEQEPVDIPDTVPIQTDIREFFAGIEKDSPSEFEVITHLSSYTTVGAPDEIDEDATSDTTQNSDSTANTQSSGKSAGKSTSGGSSGGGSDSGSGSASTDTDNSLGTSLSSDTSSNKSESSSSGDDDDSSSSKSYTDIYKIVPLIETIEPYWPQTPLLASTSLTVSNIKVWDGVAPSTGASVALTWTPEGRLQSQKIWRRNSSLLNSEWQFVNLNANVNSFVDDGSLAWTSGTPVDDSECYSESLIKLRVNGIIESRAVETRLGYGADHWVILSPITLSAAPSSEPMSDFPDWTLEILAKAGSLLGGGSLSLRDCYLMPHEQSEATTSGTSVFTNRYGQTFGSDAHGEIRLSPGNNVVVLLAEDANQAPVSLQGAAVTLKVTPESEWVQSNT